MARGLGPPGLARAPHERGGVKKRGTFPRWVMSHLCQQFQLSNNVSCITHGLVWYGI